jgi:hypothetical protein
MGEYENIIEQLAYDEGYAAAMRHVAEREQKRRERRAKERYEHKYFFIQRASGLLAIALGIVSVPLLDYDATASLLFIPMGLALLLTKKHLLQIMGHEGDY